jgi:hypothetical protein
MVKAAILSSATALMVRDLDAPIHGSFYFRQAHVAANIEHFLENGPSLVPATYNLDAPYSIFDFPAYQLLVASICRILGSDPLLTARAVNVAIFAFTFVLIDRLLLAAGMGRMHRIASGFLFCFSPMNLFYYQSPFVDPLAIGLSLLSLYAFIKLETAGGPGRLPLLAMLLAASVLSTLIKSPIYLPVFVAVVVTALWRRFEPMGPWKFLVYVTAIGTTVLGFKAWSNRVNGVAGFFDANEPREYFGPLTDRFDPESWHRIGGILHHDAANTLTVALALLGVVVWAFRSRSRHKPLFLGLVLGWILTLVVFFNRFTWHNYYLLGFELPLAFFGAYALHRMRVQSRAWRRRGGARLGLPTSAALAVVAGYTAVASTKAMRDLAATPTEWIRASGEFIHRSTTPDDFVVYLVESQDFRDWNPVFLYFAQRRGYNVTTRRIERRPSILARLEARYASSTGRFVVFCPARAAPRLAPLIESQGARLVEAGPSGWLYQMRAASGRRPDQRSSRQIETKGPGRSTLEGRSYGT